MFRIASTESRVRSLLHPMFRATPGTKVAVLGMVGALLALTAVTADAAGPKWTVVSSPNKGNPSTLSGVSCISPTLCIAVGDSGLQGSEKTLSEKWNGTKLTVVPSPPTTGSEVIELNGISCVSASFCIAVGRQFKSGGDVILSEKWNGSTWSLLTSPTIGPDASLDLNSVSCKTSTFCMAVGWFVGEPAEAFAMKWNGSSWATEAVPDDSNTDDNILKSVSCPTTTLCIAVGTGASGQLIDKWNGTTWSIVSNTANFALFGVRCRSTTFCMAVGAKAGMGTNVVTLAEKFNGTTWSVLTSPNVSGSPADFLLSVSCTGTTFCMAAGQDQGSGTTEKTLTEQWNGTKWSVVTSPNTSSSLNIINSVSCTTATGGNFCLAVGQAAELTLVEKYS